MIYGFLFFISILILAVYLDHRRWEKYMNESEIRRDAMGLKARVRRVETRHLRIVRREDERRG